MSTQIYCASLLVLILLSCGPKYHVQPIDWSPKEYSFNSTIRAEFVGSQDGGRAATQYSFNGEYEKALQVLDVGADTVKIADQEWKLRLEDFQSIPAKEEILSRAADHQILMFNEAHYTALHRHFLFDMLDDLYELGFRTLALETLGMTGRYEGEQYDKEIEARGYPKIHTGYYTKEPQFGRLVRRAVSLGFHIIGYDQGSGSEREIMGAKGILKRMDELEDPGKLVILCGWDHIKEGPTGTYWEYALAGRLKEYSGFDPLTINQTRYSPRSQKVFEDSIYQLVDVEEASILIKDGASFAIGKDTSWYDLMVFHPRERFENGYPIWLLEDKGIHQLSMPALELSFPSKLFFFAPGDDIEEAVPIHIMEVTSWDDIHIPHFVKRSKIIAHDGKASFLIQQK